MTAIGGRSNAHQQLVAKERFLHEVHRAKLHGLDRGINGPKTCHDDERRVHAHFAELAQHVDSRESWHPHVGQNYVEAVVFRALESFFAGCHRLHGIARGAQHPRGALAHPGIVVDEQHPSHEIALTLSSRLADTMVVTRFALGALLVLSSAACVSAPIAPATPTPAAARPRLVKVQVSERGVIVVREVPLEDYVQATAISEVAPAAGDVSLVERMLEVQTIVSRTYAVSNLGRHAQEGFDLCSTTHCQLYDPQRLQTSKWAAASSQAIRQTSGTIVTFGNQPVQALFHADCGGYTSTAGSVWGGSDRPYLAARPDQGSAADAHAAWQYDVTLEALARAFNADPRTRLERPLETIEVVDRDAAGRANRIALGSRSAKPGTDDRAAGDPWR